MRMSISNRGERNTATPMENGTSRKDSYERRYESATYGSTSRALPLLAQTFVTTSVIANRAGAWRIG
jgi:hypothetical protein